MHVLVLIQAVLLRSDRHIVNILIKRKIEQVHLALFFIKKNLNQKVRFRLQLAELERFGAER